MRCAWLGPCGGVMVRGRPREGWFPSSRGQGAVLPRARRCSPEGKVPFSRGQCFALPRVMFCPCDGSFAFHAQRCLHIGMCFVLCLFFCSGRCMPACLSLRIVDAPSGEMPFCVLLIVVVWLRKIRCQMPNSEKSVDIVLIFVKKGRRVTK